MSCSLNTPQNGLLKPLHSSNKNPISFAIDIDMINTSTTKKGITNIDPGNCHFQLFN